MDQVHERTRSNQASNRSAAGNVKKDARALQFKRNNTGLPDNLKSGIESMSGFSMDAVNVHYNSEKPAQLNAFAFAQGHDIHVGPGQEKHLPHEAWHVVQQAQGRVQPTIQVKGGVPVNDNADLEKEADVMGAKAVQLSSRDLSVIRYNALPDRQKVVQGMFWEYDQNTDKYIWHYGPVTSLIWAPRLKKGGEQETKDKYGVWIRKYTQEHIAQESSETAKKIADEILPGVSEGLLTEENKEKARDELAVHVDMGKEILQDSPLLAPVQETISIMSDGIKNRNYKTLKDEGRKRFELLHKQASTYEKALDSYLKRTSTILKILGLALTGGVVYGLGLWLATLTLPIWVVAPVNAMGILYGAFMTYHWLKTDAIPLIARLILAGGNTYIWAEVIGQILFELATSHTLKTLHIGAIPFAITLEILIRYLISEVIKLRAEYQARKKRHERDRRGGSGSESENYVLMSDEEEVV